MNKLQMNLKYKEGISLISLVITIVILIILASININALLGNNGLLSKPQTASDETNKSQATDTINLKITNIQITSYTENQQLPNLQYLADKLCEDNDIEYVLTASKGHSSLDKIDVTNISSIFTKLKTYPYEFEINSSLSLASIDGVAVTTETDSWAKKNTWEKLFDIGFTLDEIVNTEVIFNKATSNDSDINYMLNNTESLMPSVLNSTVAMKIIGNNPKLSNLIFGNSSENISVNSTWVSAILNNSNAISALDQTNPTTVPNMTSHTSPSGIVTESSYQSGHPGWQAFNNNSTMYYSDWASEVFDGTTSPAYIEYQFTEPVLVYKFYMQNRNTNDKWVEAPINFSLLGSNDGETWDNLGNYINPSYVALASNTYTTQNITKRYSHYRINITSAKLSDGTASSWASIQRLQFYAK